MSSSAFARLDALARRLHALDHAVAILGADEATHMAPGGGEDRAASLAVLSGMRHRMATAPEVAGWIGEAAGEALDDDQALALREFARVHRNLTCLPADFVEARTHARLRCEQLWRDTRARNDWAGFAPALEGVVALVREEAALRAEALNLSPYDALMEQYDPGARVAEVAPLLDDMKSFLTGFVPQALETRERRLAGSRATSLAGSYPVEKQRALGLSMMAALGFDLAHGSLSVSHHPFCGGVPSDVRITTRYRADEFLSALMGTLHETGHALYEQNLPREWAHWPLGEARGMAIHESQSLFVEKQIGRNPAFWRWALPLVERHLGESLTLDDILPRIHHVERGLIRVDADEVTYPLHIVLRFELERALVDGALEVADLPDAWDAGMRALLGLSTLDNPADGPMQDVHWPSAAFGYFPSYTLGAMIAAQLWAAIEHDHPDIDDDLAAGRFERLNAWRRERVWSLGSRLSTPELIRHATGEALDAGYLKRHLERRYGG